ncbi:methyltransferase [Bradyrhizobium liaoningense]|nr:methyltransferase [Bradyrhizobium liaoningense]
MSGRVEPDDSLDYFPTPPWATRALVEQVLTHLKIDAQRYSAREPACGEGHIAEVLGEYFAEVFASDIFNYGYGELADFLNEHTSQTADFFVTNPPFDEKAEAFLARMLQLARVGVAMFVRLQWLEGGGRYENIYSKTPPTCVAFFSERVNLCKGRWDPDGTTATAYVWLVWLRGRRIQPPFWIPPVCRETLTRPDDAERFTTHPVTRRSEAA